MRFEEAITPQKVFLLVKFLYATRKNTVKVFAFGKNPSIVCSTTEERGGWDQ